MYTYEKAAKKDQIGKRVGLHSEEQAGKKRIIYIMIGDDSYNDEC